MEILEDGQEHLGDRWVSTWHIKRFLSSLEEEIKPVMDIYHSRQKDNPVEIDDLHCRKVNIA